MLNIILVIYSLKYNIMYIYIYIYYGKAFAQLCTNSLHFTLLPRVVMHTFIVSDAAHDT